MPAVYDSWERLVAAVLSREDLRRSGMRTPSEMSSISERSSFSYISPFDYSANSSSTFTYEQILRATENLSRSRLIFYGVTGEFYRGVLEEGGVPVVVKMADLEQLSFLKSEMDFYAKVSHPRFVPLVGYCMEHRHHKFVVYEDMVNGSLTSALKPALQSFDAEFNGQSQPLDWKSRLRVATGAAQALCHLHHECVPPLVHRNVEASSILIDENYDGYLGRVYEVCEEKGNKEKENRKRSLIFRLFRPSKSSTASTISDSSNATCADDVYCFGKVLLQLVTGISVRTDLYNSMAPNSMNNILPYINTYDEELFSNIMDSCLTMDRHSLYEIFGIAIVAKACLCPEPSKRPLMKNVLKVLEDFNLAEAPEGSQLGASETKGSALSNDMWTALWNGQSSPPSGIWDVPSLMTFSFKQLKAATENFRRDGLLGEGRFGEVYKGRLPKSASNRGKQPLIAVKRCKPESMQGFEEWQTEIKILGRLSHPNFIKLHGYCYAKKELLLVYDYMPKGSLSNHLFGRSSAIQPLSWDERLDILIGAARGLAYLHALKTAVIFRDFRTSSILLDTLYKPKLSGFDLAKVGPLVIDAHMSPLVMGTSGYYTAPEYVATGVWNVKSDVYSFGVVMVEVLTGLRAIDNSRSVERQNMVKWIMRLLSDNQQIKNIVDPRLEGGYSVRGAVRMVQLALTCLSKLQSDRPSMKQVVEALLGI